MTNCTIFGLTVDWDPGMFLFSLFSNPKSLFMWVSSSVSVDTSIYFGVDLETIVDVSESPNDFSALSTYSKLEFPDPSLFM